MRPISAPPRAREVMPRPGTPSSATVLAIAALVACSPSGEGGDTARATETPGDGWPEVRLEHAIGRLVFERPVFVTHAPSDSSRLFVAEQTGRIQVFAHAPGTDHADVFLDLGSRVHRGHNEEGLLSLAFHPDYAANGRFFVYYSASDPRRSVLAEYRVSPDDPDRADPASGRSVLEVEQPWGNHNGSTLLFGPDGYLYLSLGDGGHAGDPLDSGQDLSSLLGSILRIDVDARDPGLGYRVPGDNPFVAVPGARPEIYAYGLRNVWRMSFDPVTGDLWAGDVGQNAIEEIDLIVPGGNYGWRIREGTRGYRPDQPHEGPLIDPVAEYGRTEGVSVTGGYVYRGADFPSLTGVYLFADYVSGNIWGIRRDAAGGFETQRVGHAGQGRYITSFGVDARGELYVCAFDRPDARGRPTGRLYRVVTD